MNHQQEDAPWQHAIHGSASATPRARANFKPPQESTRALVARYRLMAAADYPAVSQAKLKFAPTETDYQHIDMNELCLARGKQRMFRANGRVAKLSHVEFFDAATKRSGVSRGSGNCIHAGHTPCYDVQRCCVHRAVTVSKRPDHSFRWAQL